MKEFDSKFDGLVQGIIKNEDLDIDYRGSKKSGNIQRFAITLINVYQLWLRCEYDNLVKFISTLEKDNRIYNIEELKIKNPIQKNSPGVEVSMKVFEINIGN